MTDAKMPARIWATCNGMSTRLPDGRRQFIGGWSEDKGRPRAEAFIRADIVEQMAEALRRARESVNAVVLSTHSVSSNADLRTIDNALSTWESSND